MSSQLWEGEEEMERKILPFLFLLLPFPHFQKRGLSIRGEEKERETNGDMLQQQQSEKRGKEK